MAILALSGKKQSGKSTVGKIANIILNSPHLNNQGVLDFLKKDTISSDNWQIKMFAEKLKQIVCLLIGCTMEQLEDEQFKSKELTEEWIKYKYYSADQPRVEMKITPRLLLQLLGTECGRDIIHPNIWVNSLMADYKSKLSSNHPVDDLDWEPRFIYPNWIITDMRFPNELKAVEDRDGITIRVNRNWFKSELPNGGTLTVQRGILTGHEDEILGKEHPSETALDNAKFDYTINNDGTLEDLINKVREILTKEKFI